jgi:hypothetical protein
MEGIRSAIAPPTRKTICKGALVRVAKVPARMMPQEVITLPVLETTAQIASFKGF